MTTWTEVKEFGETRWRAQICATTYTVSKRADGFSVCDGNGGAFGPFPTLKAAQVATEKLRTPLVRVIIGTK